MLCVFVNDMHDGNYNSDGRSVIEAVRIVGTPYDAKPVGISKPPTQSEQSLMQCGAESRRAPVPSEIRKTLKCARKRSAAIVPSVGLEAPGGAGKHE